MGGSYTIGLFLIKVFFNLKSRILNNQNQHFDNFLRKILKL
jgi:hypothetical protein